MDYCYCHRWNPDSTNQLEEQLRLLEREYFDQSSYQRRKDLLRINKLRNQLNLPEVDNNLQPIIVELTETKPHQTIEEVVMPKLLPVSSLQPEILRLAVRLNLSMHVLNNRIKEYLAVDKSLDHLSEEEKVELFEHLNTELANKIRGEQLEAEYNLLTAEKSRGFTYDTIVNLNCSLCGEGFPLQGWPHSRPSLAVPFILGGLTFLLDEKGAPHVYHGYMDSNSCAGRAIK